MVAGVYRVDGDVCHHRRDREMLEGGQERARGALAKFLEGTEC